MLRDDRWPSADEPVVVGNGHVPLGVLDERSEYCADYAYDWRITFWLDDRPHDGQCGRAHALQLGELHPHPRDRAKAEALEALTLIREGIYACAEVFRVRVDTDTREPLLHVDRLRDGDVATTEGGSVRWLYL
jgi:hypothetical protein